MIRLIIVKFGTYQGWKGAHTLDRDWYLRGTTVYIFPLQLGAYLRRRSLIQRVA